MSGLKKWMAIIMTSVTIMGNMAGQGISVMAVSYTHLTLPTTSRV